MHHDFRKTISPDFAGGAEFSELYFQSTQITPGDPLLNYREISYDSGRGKQNDVKYTTIVFPCLALSTIQQHEAIKGSYSTLRKKLSTNILDNRSTNCTVHLERTLDEAYYPGLTAEDFEDRNKDQVVSWRYKTAQSKTIPILMVPQLWLWRFGGIIVSAYPAATRDGNYYNSFRDKGQRPQILLSDPDEQMGIIIANEIELFGKECSVGGVSFPAPLDIFEINVVSVLSAVNSYMNKTKPSRIDYHKEREFLHVLSDIRSELVMIQNILDQQEEVVCKLLKDTPKSTGVPSERKERLKNAQITTTKYRRRATKIDGDAERIEKAVQDKLDLKRAYASVKDAHSSLLLSTAVIGFTVITIIFAPLAFLTALFALRFDGFDRLQSKDGAYTSWKMGVIFVCSEILTIALTVALVAGSLWYINSLDRIKVEDMSKGAIIKDEVKVNRKRKGERGLERESAC